MQQSPMMIGHQDLGVGVPSEHPAAAAMMMIQPRPQHHPAMMTTPQLSRWQVHQAHNNNGGAPPPLVYGGTAAAAPVATALPQAVPMDTKALPAWFEF